MDSTENNEFENVSQILRSLQQVKAPANFEAALFQKIDSQEFTNRRFSESIWSRLFSRYKLIPSAALAILAVLVIYFVNIQPDKGENPFAIQPKVREDVIVTDPFSSAGNIKSEIEKKEKDLDNQDKSQTAKAQTQPAPGSHSSTYRNHRVNVLAASAISKSGLNFRHINLNVNEKKEVYKLKQRMEELFNDNSSLK